MSESTYSPWKYQAHLNTLNLKPCPHCGKAVKAVETEDGFGYGKSWVVIIGCCSRMMADLGGNKDMDTILINKMVRCWNTRI